MGIDFKEKLHADKILHKKSVLLPWKFVFSQTNQFLCAVYGVCTCSKDTFITNFTKSIFVHWLELKVIMWDTITHEMSQSMFSFPFSHTVVCSQLLISAVMHVEISKLFCMNPFFLHGQPSFERCFCITWDIKPENMEKISMMIPKPDESKCHENLQDLMFNTFFFFF